MPNIEIISLRFNLAKDDDRRIFEALQEKADTGKRTEFIKQVLFDRIVEENPEGKPDAGPIKKQARAPKAAPSTRPFSGTSKPGPAVASCPEASALPDALPCTVDQATQGQEDHQKHDAEAAGLVSQFVQ